MVFYGKEIKYPLDFVPYIKPFLDTRFTVRPDCQEAFNTLLESVYLAASAKDSTKIRTADYRLLPARNEKDFIPASKIYDPNSSGTAYGVRLLYFEKDTSQLKFVKVMVVETAARPGLYIAVIEDILVCTHFSCPNEADYGNLCLFHYAESLLEPLPPPVTRRGKKSFEVLGG